MNSKLVYVGMTAEFFHHGHANILIKAREYGNVMVGLLTDSALLSHKRLPMLTWEQRKTIIANFNGVTEVVPQHEWEYSNNILKYRPDFMVHGDDWNVEHQKNVKDKALAALKTYGGRLIEIAYTDGVSSSVLQKEELSNGILPSTRVGILRRLINAKSIVRVLESHNAVTASIVDQSEHFSNSMNEVVRFDAIWSSSLTDSTSRGLPDTEALSISSRLLNIMEIFNVTNLPLIMDADTGGDAQHLSLHIKSMERIGISACIIEDKKGLKKNSLLGTSVSQEIEEPLVFAEKIDVAIKSKISQDFMVIARLESLILELGMEDALNRARLYCEAGVDGIMIHSRKKSPSEIFQFASIFRKEFPDVPLISVPTTYNEVYEKELVDAGFNVVIYANHMLRAAVPAMRNVANTILENGRSFEVDSRIESMASILKFIPGTV